VASITFRDGSQRVIKAGDLLSGANLSRLAGEAAETACLRQIATGEKGIRIQDVLAAAEKEIDDVARGLTPANCRRHLSDIPRDLDVVDVQSVQKKKSARIYKYIQVA
jgi:hypothetical protein